MTKPYFENKITIGNVIQISLLIIALVVAWVRLEGKTEINAKAIVENQKGINELREQQKKREKDITEFWQREWPKVIEILNEVKHLREDIAELKKGK